ncbi:RpiR family transcriptional regulator [Companilactobacillus ginsenosidimutans]|uniref:RpiR family transcriptional regulator n=1 Tax=Companilactobacillus ginsenosidimutans TaxID=1007676 RepID=A0A0H4QDY5_9LACO|nr:RpiR family transcriptional regulator [Companilactobacillus ginsenosidimutans]
MESLILNIKQSQNSFTKTEQNIADYILNYPHYVIKDSVQELATKIPTSPASIVRFSQKFCGDGGFSQLKLQLSAESGIESNLYKELAPDDTIDSLKRKLSFRINQSLNNTGKSLSEDSIKKSVSIFERTDKIVVFGIGASMIAAEDLQQKFMRIGKTVILSENPHLLTTLLLSKSENTAVILISNSGETQEVLKIAKLTNEINIPLISITQDRPSSLSKLSTIVLATDGNTENIHLRSAATTSLISQLYTIDLLYYNYFSINYQENAKAIKTSQEYIHEKFGKG